MIGSVIAIFAAEVFEGKEDEFLAVAEQLDALTRRRAYGVGQVLQDVRNPRCYYHIRTWSSPDAIERFNADTEVQSLVVKLDGTRKLVPLVPLARFVKLTPESSLPTQLLRAASAAGS
jgi:hypothetical protein